MSILSLLQLALSLLLAVQGPNTPAATQQQALDFAKQAVELAAIEIRSMQNQPSNQATSSQETQEPQAPAAPTATSQPQPAKPTLGSNTFPVELAPQNPYTVEITQSIPKTGGVLYFKVKKDGKPIEVIEKLTSNLTHQVFLRLPEDLPPGQGIFHIYIPEQTADTQNPSVDLVIEGTPVNVPISFVQ